MEVEGVDRVREGDYSKNGKVSAGPVWGRCGFDGGMVGRGSVLRWVTSLNRLKNTVANNNDYYALAA